MMVRRSIVMRCSCSSQWRRPEGSRIGEVMEQTSILMAATFPWRGMSCLVDPSPPMCGGSGADRRPLSRRSAALSPFMGLRNPHGAEAPRRGRFAGAVW